MVLSWNNADNFIRHVECLYVCVRRMTLYLDTSTWRVQNACRSFLHSTSTAYNSRYFDVEFCSNNCVGICTVATGFFVLFVAKRRTESFSFVPFLKPFAEAEAPPAQAGSTRVRAVVGTRRQCGPSGRQKDGMAWKDPKICRDQTANIPRKI